MTPDLQLAAWREQGWARLDIVAFVFMEGLARRAVAQEGEARQRLDARLAQLMKDYAARIESAGALAPAPEIVEQAGPEASGIPNSPNTAGTPGTVRVTRAPRPVTALTELSKELTDHAAKNKSALPWTAHYPELPLLDEFQQLWSRVSASLRVQESQFEVPDNAGPLNSSHLVHRSLALMRELAPGYLQHFLAYVDVMSWLEPMVVPAVPPRDNAKAAAKSAGKAPAKPAKGAAGARKTAAKPARKTT
ncbi:DUF2894 domain-containing protein [Bordetella sp. N]|uniref:DUF2894 domain-containing protein n=1 Tax=Bordetella sp. N TaxID=1746199 RepID=UPI000B0AF283|nr:DUF2894 domain-containing protein [Bordetella sp. N]